MVKIHKVSLHWCILNYVQVVISKNEESVKQFEKCRAVTRLSFGVNINVKTNETGGVSCYSGVVTGTSKYVAP